MSRNVAAKRAAGAARGLSRRDLLRGAAGAVGTGAAAWLAGGPLARAAGRAADGLTAEVAADFGAAQGITRSAIPEVFLVPDAPACRGLAFGDEARIEDLLARLDAFLARGEAAAAASGQVPGQVPGQDTGEDTETERWSADGHLWLWAYERRRGPEDYERLLRALRAGRLELPLTPAPLLHGAMPAEAILRASYAAGRFERRGGLPLTGVHAGRARGLPGGLPALWAGAGARWAWKGLANTEDEDGPAWAPGLVRWTAPEGSALLLKWYAPLAGPRGPGGYAEAYDPERAVALVTEEAEANGFAARHPERVLGLFGRAPDEDGPSAAALTEAARRLDGPARRVRTGIGADYAAAIEERHAEEIKPWRGALGPGAALRCADLAEHTSRLRRAVERLRGAEALAGLAALEAPGLLDGRAGARDEAQLAMGLFFEESWADEGPDALAARARRQEDLLGRVEGYVGALEADAAEALGRLVSAPAGGPPRVFCFNPLGWPRSDVLDLGAAALEALGLPASAEAARPGAAPGEVGLHALDLASGAELPCQWQHEGGETRLRIWVRDVPAVGYRVLELQRGAGAAGFAPAGRVSGDTVVTDHFQLELTPEGEITRLLDRARGNRDLVRAIEGRGCNALLPGGLPPGADAPKGELTVESQGPVSVTLRAASDAPVPRETRVTLYAERACVDLRNELYGSYRAEGAPPAWDFCLDAAGAQVWHEEQGAVLRAASAREGGDYAEHGGRRDWLSFQHFVALDRPGLGLTLASPDALFFRLGESERDRLDTSLPRLRVLAGGLDGLDGRAEAQRRSQRFRLAPHDRYQAADAMRTALEQQCPLLGGPVRPGAGPLPPERHGLLTISDPDTLLWALKPAEEGPRAPEGPLVARLWHLGTLATRAELTLSGARRLRAATRTSHLETPLGMAPVHRGALRAELRPGEMRTFQLDVERATPEGGRIYMPDLRR